MEENIPKEVSTNTNNENSDDLNPNSDSPWTSDPTVTTEPEITVILPNNATITEVTLKNPNNVEDFTVIIKDNNGNNKTVSYIQT